MPGITTSDGTEIHDTGFTEKPKQMAMPTLVMHGEGDQVVPFAGAGPLSAALVPGAVLKAHPGLPHGVATTHADRINADLLAFVRG